MLEGARDALARLALDGLGRDAERSSAATKAFDHSARSGQPVQETMFPSTTRGALDVRPAGELDVRAERREPELFRPCR